VELSSNLLPEVPRLDVWIVEESFVLRRVEFPGGLWVLELIVRGVTGHLNENALYSIVVVCGGPSEPALEQRENCKPSSRESREAMPGGMGWPW